MKRLFLILSALTLMAVSVVAQTRPQTTPPRPTATPDTQTGGDAGRE